MENFRPSKEESFKVTENNALLGLDIYIFNENE